MSKLRIPRKEKKKAKKEFPHIHNYDKHFIEIYYLLKKTVKKLKNNNLKNATRLNLGRKP